MPVALSTQFAALLVALAWITQGHVLAAPSVLPMVPTSALPLAVIGDAMFAIGEQACPVCPRASVAAAQLLGLSNSDNHEIQTLLFVNPGASGEPCLAPIGKTNDGPSLPRHIRFCRWLN